MANKIPMLVRAKAFELAAQGMDSSQIGTMLRLTSAQMASVEMLEAVESGRQDGIKKVTAALLASAQSGNTSAARLYLQRTNKLEPEPELEPVILGVPVERTEDREILDHVNRMFDLQKRLLDESEGSRG